METTAPSYLTSPVEALKHAAALETQVLAAGDRALATFLHRVASDAQSGSLTSGAVEGYWKAGLETELAHPAFVDIRADLLAAVDGSQFAADAYTAASMALEVAHNSSATFAERGELLDALFAAPDASKLQSLTASLSAKVDSWLRRRISRYMLRDLGNMGPDALTTPRFNEFPTEPHKTATLVSAADWENDDRPGQINWRARMQRDIRTAYTSVYGRQFQRQLERHGFAKKMWVSHEDERTRPTHLAANGQVVPLHSHFHVGASSMLYPGDRSAPYGETVNCRCLVIAAPE